MVKNRENGLEELLGAVFGKYPGSKLVEFLGEGACVQAVVDGQSFSLLKKDGALLISKDSTERPDISVILNREACEYLASSGELDEFVSRTRQCIEGTHDNCRMSYEISAGPARMLAKGYLGFARKMGII